MGCCPSKNTVGVINTIQVSPASNGITGSQSSFRSQQDKNGIRLVATDPALEGKNIKPIRNKTSKDKFGDHWFSNEFMLGSTKALESVCRMGFTNTYFDARQKKSERFKSMQRPSVEKGQLWSDSSFSRNIPKDDDTTREIVWKRPHEICPDPQLFVENADRFCVNQGGAGTCWFNAVLAPLADKKDIFNQIVSQDSSRLGKDGYDGTFHCKLWRLGQWFDVYIDDILPTSWCGPWGAHSIRENEMWVSLVEKAFTKFFGDFITIYGGPSQRAFATLTGGCSQTLYTRKSSSDVDRDLITEDEMFKRIQRALNKGLIITTSMDKEDKRKKFDQSLRGLVPDHCYTINGAMTVSYRSKNYNLIRMRNPWGKSRNKDENGEWKGPWSDGSSEWNEVDNQVKEKLNFRVQNDGEFWISQQDFFKFFPNVIFSSMYPEFGEYFEADMQLNYIHNILGEWQLVRYEKNVRVPDKQKFIFRIPTKGVENDGRHHVVMQLLQEENDTKKGEEDENGFFSPLNLYKVEEMNLQNEGKWICLREIVSSHSHFEYSVKNANDNIYNHRLEPGLYITMPTYYPDKIKKTEIKSFCVRIFSAIPDLQCKQFVGKPRVYSSADLILKDKTSVRQELLIPYDYVAHAFGHLAATKGTQQTLRTAKENQFLLEIPSGKVDRDGKIEVLIQLYQELLTWPEINNQSLFLNIYKIEGQGEVDTTPWYCVKKMNYSRTYPPAETSDQDSYWSSQEICQKCRLPPGLYILHPSLYSEINYALKCYIRAQSNAPIACKLWTTSRVTFVTENDLSLNDKAKAPKLDYIDYAVGEYEKGSGGYQTLELVKNQKVMIEIPTTNSRKDSYEDVVIQLMQQAFDFPLWETNRAHIGLNVLEVDYMEKRNSKDWICLKDIHQNIVYPSSSNKESTYFGYSEICHRYSLKAGKYVLLPSLYQKSDRDRLFCVAVRTSCKIKSRIVSEKQHMFIRESESVINVGGGTFQLDAHQVQFGEWINNKNAGGQINNRLTFASNPQFCIKISGDRPYPVLVDLLQETIQPVQSIACYIFRVDNANELPANYSFFIDKWDDARKDIVTGKKVFMASLQASGYYILEPGEYVAVLFTNKPNEEKKFALFTAAPPQSKMSIRLVQSK